MAADDASGDELRYGGGVGAAVFHVMQGGGANLQPLLVFLVPLRDARVEIPAVVVEPRGIGDSAHAVQIFLLELAEADDDIGHLHAGVVDVVLHFDR